MVLFCLLPRSPVNYLSGFGGLEEVSRKPRVGFPVPEGELRAILVCKLACDD